MALAKNQKYGVTPEAIAMMEGYGFATIYDADGNVIEFMVRDHYDRCVADGTIKPRTPGPKAY